MTINELFQSVLDTPYSGKVSAGREAANKVIGYFMKGSGVSKVTDEVFGCFMGLVSTYIGVDGSVSRAEYDYFVEILGLTDVSYDSFCATISADMETVELVCKVIDGAPQDIQYAFVILGLNICACDGVLTASEQALLSKYIDAMN